MTKIQKNGWVPQKPETRKNWTKPGFQKIEVAARINATALLKLDPTATLS